MGMMEKRLFFGWASADEQGRRVIVAISEAQRRAVAKYNAANYERIELRVKKGLKEAIKTHAEKRGETLNEFVNRAIKEAMEREGASLPFETLSDGVEGA